MEAEGGERVGISQDAVDDQLAQLIRCGPALAEDLAVNPAAGRGPVYRALDDGDGLGKDR
jgi:hypothetical protein